MSHHGPYSFLHGVAVLLTLGGGLSLLAYLLAPDGVGPDFLLQLTGRGGCVVLGIVLLVLADLGTRLVRLETKLGTLPSDGRVESEQPRPALGPVERSPSEQVAETETRFRAEPGTGDQ